MTDPVFRSKTPRSTRLCWGPRRFRTKFIVKLRQPVYKTAFRTSTASKAKSISIRIWKPKHNRNTSEKKSRSTTSFSGWSTRIERWLAFRTSSNSRLKPIWSSLSMRKGLCWGVRRKWKPLKMRWCASMPSSNNNAWIKFRPLKMRPKKLVTLFLRDLRLRRWDEEPRRSSRRICAMSSTMRSLS